MAKFKKSKVILLIIVVIAAFLRLYNLGQVPVSLFGDELDVGYHAYSILKTARDYTGNFLPLHFHSLAEWRTPLYLYSTVPTVGIFGISAWGVRLPAAVFGILSVYLFYLLIKEIFANENLALISSFLLAVSPWFIQYSRAAFEVTQLIFLLLAGLLFFFKSLKTKGKHLWLSSLCLGLTPWVYSSAKLFTPVFILFLLVMWRKEILSFSKKYLLTAFTVLVIVGLPIGINTVFGGGAQRFNYISIFSDPTTEPEVGVLRQRDARMRGELGEGLTPKFFDRVVHNKFTFWGKNIINNYFDSFSINFFFIKGDYNLRHSIGIGEFYKIEAIPLILGLIFFFSSRIERRKKTLIAFWILFGAFPSAITRGGGGHATRLVLMLPPIIFIISYGLFSTYSRLKGKIKILLTLAYLGLFVVSFIFYQHEFWVHYPWDSERWWHSGFEESIKTIKEIDADYDKIVISTANEPPWTFFAAWYEYPPQMWQKDFPIENKVYLEGFGEVSHIDKYYFASPSVEGFYSWHEVIDSRTLYLATEKEVKVNLIMEPERTPPGLKLIKAIAYPSGEPVFYLFTGNN